MKKLLFIPLFLIIVSISASFVAFLQSNQLNNGYLYVDDTQKEVVFEGEYFLLVGNLGQESEFITITNQSDGVLLTVYNLEEEIIMEHLLVVNKKNEVYDADIITSVISTEMNDVDELDESLLVVSLEQDSIYEIMQSRTENHNSDEDLDLVFVNIDEGVYRTKKIMENVSFTTGIFTILSIVTIASIWFIKKDD